MKRIINSKYFTWFRKLYLQKLLILVTKEMLDSNNSRPAFICHRKNRLTKFICWKELKEVKNNINSKYISKKYNIMYGCTYPWFEFNRERISFLEECLQKFDKNDNKRTN